MSLHTLKDTHKRKTRRRVGRGTGAGRGKTCGRGIKGQGARSGYKRRYGNEGGNLPLYMRLPTRGFSRARFQKKLDVINLYQIEKIYNDGDVVNLDSLREAGFVGNQSHGIKVLSKGELTKKVEIHANAISAEAKVKVEKAGATFTQL